MNVRELTTREMVILRSALGDYYAMRIKLLPRAPHREVADLRDKLDLLIELKMNERNRAA